eukprot:CAMPEP_0202349806 /NCGR_PEP_ID=MMETSP1126-20121109/7141_1 /ASSEMBLY_ACC=CAM_ASM_000457 /TAXON_ID=3047 /ORGANISM="Dunaliella tertiolecta, Strain CCMP1320" /LENGTH=524 /DNA_ID=CAMNT_0048941671 /DNA_START=172 /DNA_END=1746 /DNA_ORIENTATION=-
MTEQGYTTQGMQHHAVILVEDSGPSSFSWAKLAKFFGPGLLMCIAYVDPGNLESDLQTGATTGYTLLWLLLVTTMMGFLVQMQAAKLGVVTGKNLAEMCRAEYPRPAAYLLWIMAEFAIIGSDVQEVIGSAIALSLLSWGRIPLWAGALLSAVASFAMLLIERAGIRKLEALFAVLIATMVASFGVMFARAGVPTSEVASGFLIPNLPQQDIATAVALFGSLIMPHNIYLHSALVQNRNLVPSVRDKREAMDYFRIESGASLVASLVINLFVVSVFATGFYRPDQPPPDIGLKNAGEFLGASFGEVSVYVWGLGLLAAGQSSTMTGTYTGQFVMSGFLDLKVSPWARIVVTRAVALVPTMAVALAMDPASTQLDKLNQGLNLLQSIQLPFALIPVLTFTGSKRIMGNMANGTLHAASCWAVSMLVIAINLTAIKEVAESFSHRVLVILGAGMAAYFGFIMYLLVNGVSSRLKERHCQLSANVSEGGYQALPDSAPQEDEQDRQPQQQKQGVQQQGMTQRAGEGQ